MEKLSVVTARNKVRTKESASDVHCPLCGAVLGYNTNVPKCPVHGTRPWEGDERDTGNVPTAETENRADGDSGT
jgi:uncharacterized Zn finger protein (UPF0148 family)